MTSSKGRFLDRSLPQNEQPKDKLQNEAPYDVSPSNPARMLRHQKTDQDVRQESQTGYEPQTPVDSGSGVGEHVDQNG